MKIIYFIKILFIFYLITILGNLLTIYLNIAIYKPGYLLNNSINIFDFYTNMKKNTELRPILFGYGIWFFLSGFSFFMIFLPVIYHIWNPSLKFLLAIMALLQAFFFSQFLKSFDGGNTLMFLFALLPALISFFLAIYVQSRMQIMLAKS
jgi:hypothetical protein